MLFNSYIFIFLFLPTTFVFYFYLNHKRLTEASKGLLVFSSLFFYSWWNISYLPLILISMLLNYVIGRHLSRRTSNNIPYSQKTLLIIGVICNLLPLAYYKYSDFFLTNINFICNTDLPLLNLALPLAISFYTFQQIAYLVDSYRQETKEYDFLNYIVFVTFFPQLIAGPIVHHEEMMPQFAQIRNKVRNYRHIAMGLFVFTIGLSKKVLLADTFSVWATSGFDVAEKLHFAAAWAASLSYTLQLYFDFSGYTDMAIGIALLFNIRLPINFLSPYKSTSIQDFWQRWHITLSRFLKSYIYIPLGGNRHGEWRTYLNLFATFLIGGIWHGAGWTFIFWGALHGLGLAIHRAWKKYGFRLNKVLAWFITFNFVNLSWVFFRATKFSDAIKVLKGMFDIHSLSLSSPDTAIRLANMLRHGLSEVDGNIYTLIWLTFGLFLTFICKNSMEMKERFRPNAKNIILTALLLVICFFNLGKYSEFLYFQF